MINVRIRIQGPIIDNIRISSDSINQKKEIHSSWKNFYFAEKNHHYQANNHWTKYVQHIWIIFCLFSLFFGDFFFGCSVCLFIHFILFYVFNRSFSSVCGWYLTNIGINFYVFFLFCFYISNKPQSKRKKPVKNHAKKFFIQQ